MDNNKEITYRQVTSENDGFEKLRKRLHDLIEYFHMNNISPGEALNTCLNAIITIGRNIDLEESDMKNLFESGKKLVEANWQRWREDGKDGQ